jgi:hypothetical protein
MRTAFPGLDQGYREHNKGKGMETLKMHVMLDHTEQSATDCTSLKLSSTLEGEDMMRKEDQATSVLENMGFRRYFLDAEVHE